MYIPDLEHMIADYEDPLCRHCGMTLDDHEMVPVYRQGKLALHNFRCPIDGSNIARTLNSEYMRTYYFE